MVALSSPAIADPAEFQHGLADGIAWRQWTGELYKVSEQAHQGAAYWAAQRSIADPGGRIYVLQRERDAVHRAAIAARHDLALSLVERPALWLCAIVTHEKTRAQIGR